MGMMMLLGKKGGSDILPKEGTAWIVMPDGKTYEISSLKVGGIAYDTVNVPIPGVENAFEVKPSGKARMQFSGSAVERDPVIQLAVLESLLPTPNAPTRFIELEP